MPTSLHTPAGEALRALLPDGADPYATIDLACHTAFLARDRSMMPDLAAVVRADPDLATGLIVTLAALVDVDKTPNAMLAWLGTEDGRLQEAARSVAALAEARQEHDDAAADTLPEVTLESMRAMTHAARVAGVLAPCGTPGAYARHRKHNEDPCYRCARARRLVDAATDEQRALLKTPLTAPNRTPLFAACGTGHDQHQEFGEDPREACLATAAEAPNALPPKQRAKKEPRTRPSCGSHNGYNAHIANEEEVCTPCRKAQRVYDADRKREQRKANPRPSREKVVQECGTPRGRQAHKRKGEDPCEPCLEAQRVYDRNKKRNQRAAQPDERVEHATVHQLPARDSGRVAA